MASPIQTTITDGVAVVRIDDGKANALGHEMIDSLVAALDRAEADADAVALLGRPGRFSAGFDLAVMKQGAETSQRLVGRGAELLMRLYGFPRPVVAGCTGHALAAGALLLLSCDTRIGVDTDVKIGLPEVGIGMPLPRFGVELARERLTQREFTRATMLATIYSPAQAVEAGFLDELVCSDDLEQRVVTLAGELGAGLNRHGFAVTRENARGATIRSVLEGLAADLESFSGARD